MVLHIEASYISFGSLFVTEILLCTFCSSQAPSTNAWGATGIKTDLVLRKHGLDSAAPLGKRAWHNLGLGRRTYASGNFEEMDIQSRETGESI